MSSCLTERGTALVYWKYTRYTQARREKGDDQRKPPLLTNVQTIRKNKVRSKKCHSPHHTPNTPPTPPKRRWPKKTILAYPMYTLLAKPKGANNRCFQSYSIFLSKYSIISTKEALSKPCFYCDTQNCRAILAE